MKTFNWLIKEKNKYRLAESENDNFKKIRSKQLEAEYYSYVNRFPAYIRNDIKLGQFKEDFLVFVILGKDYKNNATCILKNIINDQPYDQIYYDFINRKWITVNSGSDSLICWYSFKNNPNGKGLDELLLPFVNVLKFGSDPTFKLNLYTTLIIDTTTDYDMFLLQVPEICSTLRVRFIHL